MTAKFVDLRRYADVAWAKDRISLFAKLHGLDVNRKVSRDGVMLYGTSDELNVFLYFLDGHDLADLPMPPSQNGDTEDDV